MPFGMRLRQLCMGVPKIRYGTRYLLRWAATERPYGPAPKMATSTVPGLTTWNLSQRRVAHVVRGDYRISRARATARISACRRASSSLSFAGRNREWTQSRGTCR